MNRRDFNKALLVAPIVASIPIMEVASPEYVHYTIARGFKVAAGIGPTDKQLSQLKDGFMGAIKEITAGKKEIFWRMKPELSKEAGFAGSEDRYKIVGRISVED